MFTKLIELIHMFLLKYSLIFFFILQVLEVTLGRKMFDLIDFHFLTSCLYNVEFIKHGYFQ